MTMGTASTMTSAVEALGLTLPGAASIPAVDSGHARMASDCGRRAVELVWDDVRPRTIVTRASFLNAVTVVMALGGSTNAVIHLIAMAGRFGIPLTLDDFDTISRVTPVLANLRPSGQHLMEDFYYAGGLPALMSRITDRLDLSCGTVSGLTVGETLTEAEITNDDVIRPLDRPIAAEGGIAVVKGSLAPDGAVIKHSAASPHLLRHRGRAVVFEDRDDLARRADDETLDVDETCVLVMRNGGPVGAPGLPEWGALPIPKKLLTRGVRDMVRISDARMSGTSFGTCVLHVAPEAARGGPLALVRDGDIIELDVPGRRLDLLVDPDELARRRASWKPPEPFFQRGYGKLFSQHVTSADQGCDFDFLHSGSPTPEPKIY
jgi:dihydroxy-acid dehydratase